MEHVRPSGIQQFATYARNRFEALVDQPFRHIRRTAKAIAQGEVAAWKLYTLGVIVDGTNPEALKKLFAAKGIEFQKAIEGKRPVVSVLPPKEYRGDIIATAKHHPDIQELLNGDEKQLLTPDGHALFYRVFAQDAPYLQPPLVAVDQETQDRSIVLMWHDNRHVRTFEQRARRYKFAHLNPGEEKVFLETGSSANPTGEKQPYLRAHLAPSVASQVKITVDTQDRRMRSMQPEERGPIPIIDLTCYPPQVIREGMYPALPAHPKLQALLGRGPQPETPRRVA